MSNCYLKSRWTCPDCSFTMEQVHALLLFLTQMWARCFAKKFPNASKYYFRIPVPQLIGRDWCGFKVQLKYPLVCPVSTNLCHCENSWDSNGKQNRNVTVCLFKSFECTSLLLAESFIHLIIFPKHKGIPKCMYELYCMDNKIWDQIMLDMLLPHLSD